MWILFQKEEQRKFSFTWNCPLIALMWQPGAVGLQDLFSAPTNNCHLDTEDHFQKLVSLIARWSVSNTAMANTHTKQVSVSPWQLVKQQWKIHPSWRGNTGNNSWGSGRWAKSLIFSCPPPEPGDIIKQCIVCICKCVLCAFNSDGTYLITFIQVMYILQHIFYLYTTTYSISEL